MDVPLNSICSSTSTGTAIAIAEEGFAKAADDREREIMTACLDYCREQAPD